MTPVELVVSRVVDAQPKGSTRHMALCPAHDDRGASLSIGEGRGGRALVRCFAGCSAPAIVAAIGLSLADLMPASDRASLRAEHEARNEIRRQLRANRPETLKRVLGSEIERARSERLRRDPGDTPHVRGADMRRAYARVEALLGVRMPRRRTSALERAFGGEMPYAVRDRRWEGYAPHDRDPQWPVLFHRGLELAAWRWAAISDPLTPPPARLPAPRERTPGGELYDHLAVQIGARLLRDHALHAGAARRGKAIVR